MTALQTMDVANLDLALNCPVGTAMAVLAGKWKLPVLRPLYLHGQLRYSDLLGQVETITAKELTRNLRELEYAGLLARTRSPGTTGDFYKLTDLGMELGTTFRALGEFGTNYLLFRRAASDRSSGRTRASLQTCKQLATYAAAANDHTTSASKPDWELSAKRPPNLPLTVSATSSPKSPAPAPVRAKTPPSAPPT